MQDFNANIERLAAEVKLMQEAGLSGGVMQEEEKEDKDDDTEDDSDDRKEEKEDAKGVSDTDERERRSRGHHVRRSRGYGSNRLLDR